MIFKNMKKIHKKASTMIYVLFLLTISLTLATVFLNNTSIFKNTFNFNNYETKLSENMQKDADLLVKLDKKLNSNWVWLIDNLSCPEVFMSWSTNSGSFDTDLKIENKKVFCSWSFEWTPVRINFNSWFTDFDKAIYWNYVNNDIDFETEWWYDTSFELTNTNEYNPNILVPWKRVDTEKQWWNYSIESQNFKINSSEEYKYTKTCFEIEKNFSENWSIEFYYKVSSEKNYDKLKFYIDSSEKEPSKSGDINWTKTEKYNISSWIHTFKWCYEKDRSQNKLSDRAWIDDIKFTWVDSALETDISSWNWIFSDWTIIEISDYKKSDWIDDNINSDNYSPNSTWTTDYPDNYEDDDADARKEINWYVREKNIYKKIFWTNLWVLDIINKNTNNTWTTIKLWEVLSWSLYLKTDKNAEIKIVEFDRNRFKNNRELIVLDSQTWSISFGTWYIQNSNLSLWTDKTNAKKFDFKNKDYAIFLKSNLWALLYNLKVETSAGSGTYIVPIDDSLENKIEFLANEIVIDKKNNYIYKEKKFSYEK